MGEPRVPPCREGGGPWGNHGFPHAMPEVGVEPTRPEGHGI